MAHTHEHHDHRSTTIVEGEREGPAVALIVLAVLAALALLIWFFAFSGVVFDRDTGDTGPRTTIDQQFEKNTGTGGGGETTVPSPAGTGG